MVEEQNFGDFIEKYEMQEEQIAMRILYETVKSIIGRLIGKGGFAEVFIGTTRPKCHKVAIKNMKIGRKKARTENELLGMTGNFDFEGMIH